MTNETLIQRAEQYLEDYANNMGNRPTGYSLVYDLLSALKAGSVHHNPDNCRKCDKELSVEEVEFYYDTCESCEREWQCAVEAWRKGGKNEALDKLYSKDLLARVKDRYTDTNNQNDSNYLSEAMQPNKDSTNSC